MLMKLSRLPISVCHAICTKCGFPSDFKIFESGAGGDFATYVGQRTHDIYRVALEQTQYQNKSLNQILSPAFLREGDLGLYLIPDQIKCKVCGNIFKAEQCTVDSEETIDAYEL
jgi:hypothetical protein